MSRRLAAVFAHPDDETYGAGATVALGVAGGLEPTTVLATSGGDGMIADPSLATRAGLTQVREAESLCAAKALGISGSGYHFLRFPDGGLAGVPREKLVGAIAEILEEVRPQVVVTFGPDGITGHGDHVTVGTACTEAFHRVREAAPGLGFDRLLLNAIPQADLDAFGEMLRERGMDPPDPAEPFQPRGVPDETVAVRVDGRSVFRKKLEALRCHRTQAEMDGIPQDVWEPMLRYECFVQAWPERPAGAPVLADVFEGLEP